MSPLQNSTMDSIQFQVIFNERKPISNDPYYWQFQFFEIRYHITSLQQLLQSPSENSARVELQAISIKWTKNHPM